MVKLWIWITKYRSTIISSVKCTAIELLKDKSTDAAKFIDLYMPATISYMDRTITNWEDEKAVNITHRRMVEQLVKKVLAPTVIGTIVLNTKLPQKWPT